MQIITALISALALASSTSALAVFEPVRRGEDLVYSPRITSPQRGDVWKVGTKQTVTWDKSSVPHNVYGKLLLGYLVGGSPDEHLDVDHPLAADFLLTKGEQTITVPNVATKHSYIIVLYGDSGDRTPKFTIES